MATACATVLSLAAALVRAQPSDLFPCKLVNTTCYTAVSDSECVPEPCEGYVRTNAAVSSSSICTSFTKECIIDGGCAIATCNVPVLYQGRTEPATHSGFNIRLQLAEGASTPDGSDILFEAARRRLQEIITADIPDFTFGSPGAYIPDDLYVDDIYIEYGFQSLPSYIGGYAGPKYIRSSFPHHPITCQIVLNSNDADLSYQAGWYAIILHEMTHCLGLGPLWGMLGFTSGSSSCTNEYNAPRGAAKEAYLLAGGSESDAANGNVPPVENLTGKSGSDCGHWAYAMRQELMTYRITFGRPPPPLSNVTIAGLHDLYYEVDFSKADAYKVDRIYFFGGATAASGLDADPMEDRPMIRPTPIFL